MSKQNENIKKTRNTSKKSKQRFDFMKSLARAQGFPVSQKRSYKATPGTTESSKRSKAEAPQQASRSTDIGSESSTTVEVEDEFEKQKEQENTKHYNDQQNLFNDWDREKINLMNRYFMSFSNGQIPHASATEVSPLPPCSKCAYEQEATIQVYFLTSKSNTITTLT
jgi:hypothetical protein